MTMPEIERLFDLCCRQILQVTVLALLAMAAMRWACRQRPHLAYVLGLIVLIKCWMPPIWSSQGGIFCWPPISHDAPRHIELRRDEPRRSSPAVVAAGVQGVPAGDEAGETDYRSPVMWAASNPEGDRQQFFAAWLLRAWFAGVVVFVSVASIRWPRWHRGITRAAAPPGDRFKALVTDTAMRVGLRRTPRLIVTTSGGGPAVYGLLRPTIVVPHRLLTADNAENLQMVLTHEMIHIRRGDLYISLFQFATSAAWWFHPAIWWICRRLTQERERSCDEELLAGLHCAPSAYAQCLLDVLRQQRHAMVPAFPGLRAVDVTQQRIEHIMQTRRAARARTPLRYWLFAAVALLVTLPGQRINLALSGEANPQSPNTARTFATDVGQAFQPDESLGQAFQPDVRQAGKPDLRFRPSRMRHKEASPAAEPETPSPASSPVNDKAADEDASATVNAQDAPAPPDKGADQPRPARLEEAIDRGIRYLKIEQAADGHWPDPAGYPGGITSLCTLTLLKWGMKPDERTAQTALTYLRAIKPSMTYSTSLQTLVFCAADAQAEQKLIKRNVTWLVERQKVAGQFTGGWGYPQAEGDNSNTAFAVWALYEADRAKVQAGPAVWRRTLDYWLNHQNVDGSWGYKPTLAGTGSMTSQGLFCVAAAAKILGDDKPDQPPAKAVEKAAIWLTKNFSVQFNPGTRGQQSWHFYYLLALAKAGRISGRAQFGDHRWSGEGVELLLSQQRPDGSWKGTGHAEDNPHLATSLALLFLMQDRK